MNRITVLAATLLLAAPAALFAQADVIVGQLNGTGPRLYANVGGTVAFSIGTTSCNVGSVPLDWYRNDNRHPVIGQNMYRLDNDRFEMIGMSHLKHGFTALQQTLCGPCQPNPTGGVRLGVGCSDPYTSSLNGSQNGLGPRFEVNASNGDYPYPFTSAPYSGALARRLQVDEAAISPLSSPTARFFGEGHYIARDDALAGNGFNNASWREFTVAGNLSATWSGTTARGEPAIMAWASVDPTVDIATVDVPQDGRFLVARKAIPLGNGTTRYEIAVHNLNSDRSAGAFSFSFPATATVSNLYFNDVDYHSGEPVDGTDWTTVQSANTLEWRVTQTFAQNQWANALRWGTLYNVSFVSDVAPDAMSLELFKPGPGTSTIPVQFPFDIELSGGPGQDLVVSLSNMDAATARGLTVISLDTAGVRGNGPLAGLYPDLLTLSGLATAAAPGNIFHWTMPAPGVFPSVPFVVPAAAVPFAPGSSLDAVAVSLDASGGLLGLTRVSRITF